MKITASHIETYKKAGACKEGIEEALEVKNYEDLRDDYRQWVAFNPNTPKSILTVLSRDPNDYVRAKVASNPSTPKTVLTVLSRDPNDYVRESVANNPNNLRP